MNKHLHGRHNQLAHGVRKNPTALWNKAGFKIGFGQYLTALKKIPGITGLDVFAANPDELGEVRIDLYAEFNRIELYFGDANSAQLDTELVHLRSDVYLATALERGLGGTFYNGLLNGVENASRRAGFKRVGGSSLDIPITVAAKRGYVLDSIGEGARKQFRPAVAEELAKNAYLYLREHYGFSVPAKTYSSALHKDIQIAEVLRIKHALYPEVPLYTEYLLNSTSEVGADDFDYNLNFHKDL